MNVIEASSKAINVFIFSVLSTDFYCQDWLGLVIYVFGQSVITDHTWEKDMLHKSCNCFSEYTRVVTGAPSAMLPKTQAI